jgi:hypothetical protein
MADTRGKSDGSSKRREPRGRAARTTPIGDTERGAVARTWRFYRSPYVALLLRAIRDGLVHDWISLTTFQVQHNLNLVQWASVVAGAPPPVEALLRQLQDVGLITVEGIDFQRDIWVRRDNFTKAPPGRIVYDPHRIDPDHRLDSDPPRPTNDIRINVSPLWADIQDALGISLGALAALQSPRARIVEPEIFPEPSPRQDYYDVFVIMPFKKEMRPIHDDHIVKVCRELSLSAGRADDFFKAHAVMADVWGAIQHAKVIVADCTGRNANVFYEMGMAHVLGKRVVLVSQNARDIPFDVGSIRYIPYEYTPRGMRMFEEKLKVTLLASIE